MTKQRQFLIPAVSLFGQGVSNQVGAKLKELGSKKALLVTDAGLHGLGMSEEIATIIRDAGVEAVIFPKAEPNPTDKNVVEGAALFKAENCDALVSLGGGSSHDATKGIGLIVSNGGKISDYQTKDAVKPSVTHIAITTTAGTGSEATALAVITDTTRKTKMPIIDEKITPTVAIIDPLLMLKKPTLLTIATGMDVLSHSIESYISTDAQPITDALAIHSIKLVNEYLPRVVANGDDIEAREQMAYAQYLGGVAFNNGGLGLVHSISHAIGGVYDLQHGIINSVIMPHVVRFNTLARTERVAEIAELLGEDIKGLSSKEAADKAVIALERINKDFGIPTSLKEMGVKEEDIDLLATNALNDICTLQNPRKPKHEELVQMIKAAMYEPVLA